MPGLGLVWVWSESGCVAAVLGGSWGALVHGLGLFGVYRWVLFATGLFDGHSNYILMCGGGGQRPSPN